MSLRCTVCPHPARKEIDEAILLGEPYRAVAARFGLGRSSLARHLEAHVGPQIERAARAKDQIGALDLWKRLAGIETTARRHVETLERLGQEAERAKDLRSAIAAVHAASAPLRELARTVEILARLRGDLEPEEKRTLNYVIVFEGGMPKALPEAIETTALPEPPKEAE